MAEKKISELPIIETPSGSAIIPIVVDSTNTYTTANTNAISASALAFYVGQQLNAARTNTTNTFVNTQNFNGAVFLNGDVNIVGNVIGGIRGEISGLEAFTSSLRNEVNGIEAYTASLKATTLISGSAQISALGFSAATNGTVSSSAQITELQYIHSTTSSLNTFTGSIQSEIGNIEAYTASLKGATIVSSSTQISNYYKFAETASANTFYGTQRLSGSLAVSNGIYLNSSSFYLNGSDVFLKETVGGNYFTIKTTGEYGIRLSSNVNKSWLIDTDGIFKPEISAGEIESYTGTKVFNSLAKIHTYTGSIGREEISGIEAYTASLKGAIEVSGQNVNVLGMLTAQQFNVTYVSSSTMYQSGSTKFGDTSDDRHEFTGSILVGGEVLGNSGLNQFTSSQNLVNLGISIVTGSLNAQTASQNLVNLAISTYTGSQNVINSSVDSHILGTSIQTASQDLVNLGISTFTGSIRNEVNGIEAYTASLKGQAIVSSSTQISNYYKFAETASANTFYGTQTFSGSFNVSGSTIQTGNNTLIGNTILSGSINISGSTTFNGTHSLVGSNTIAGNTVMSGSIMVSGSSDFKNSLFIVTGSSYFTGSHFVDGNSVFSGSINIASGSSYYRAGNKLFNYGQWGSVQTQSGSANTALSIKLETKFDGSEGVSIVNNGSGFPTRITAENTGLYNIQFSLQLNTTATETCDFSVWFAMTGSNIANSNTDFSIDKTAGGGNGVAALNLLTPITAGDYVELYWSNNTGNGQLQYKAPQSTPTRPATPSVIVTITQVA